MKKVSGAALPERHNNGRIAVAAEEETPAKCTNASVLFKNFSRETTGKRLEKDLAINLALNLLADGRRVDELSLADLMTGRLKRRAASQAIRYISHRFIGQVSVKKNGGMVVLTSRCSA